MSPQCPHGSATVSLMKTCANCGRPATILRETGDGWTPTCDTCRPGDWTGEVRALVEPATDLAGRITLSKQEAADALGVSVDFLEKRVIPDIRTISRGSRVLIPRDELDSWSKTSRGRHLD